MCVGVNAGAVCSICSVQTACLGGQERCSGRMTGDDGETGYSLGLQAAYLLLQRKWPRQTDSRAADGCSRRVVPERVTGVRWMRVWQVKGWMAGSKGEARFAPARCLRAAARPVGGGDAQTAGGCQFADRRVSQVEAGVRAIAVAQDGLHKKSARRGRERGTTERARRRRSRQQTEGPAARRL